METKQQSNMNGYAAYNAAAISLIRQAAEGYDDVYGAGFMSCTIYDTAWVSLITKPLDDGTGRRWL